MTNGRSAKVVVIGAGGLGSYVGALVARAKPPAPMGTPYPDRITFA